MITPDSLPWIFLAVMALIVYLVYRKQKRARPRPVTHLTGSSLERRIQTVRREIAEKERQLRALDSELRQLESQKRRAYRRA